MIHSCDLGYILVNEVNEVSQYENHHLENSSLPFIYNLGSVRPTKFMLGPSNWHENIEIIHITKGEGLISVNGQPISVRDGDIVVIGTNQLHAVAGGDERMYYRYLIVDRSFCLANGFDSNRIAFQPKISDNQLVALMEKLYLAYEMSDDAEYKTLTIRTVVLQLLLLLCNNHSRPSEHNAHYQRGAAYTKKAIDYISAACDKNFSLDDVAAFVGISKCYLSREFHRYTGYPFVAYVNRIRCKKAQQMLSDDRLEINEIGRCCGFENASYFARIFRRYVGMSPVEYRTKISKAQKRAEKE